MTEIIVDEDCGNAPKKLFLKEISIGFAKGDDEVILGNVTDDVSWNVVGDKRIEGKVPFSEALERTKKAKAEELIISNIITHGYAGSVDGTMKLKGGKAYAFCDVYGFNSSRNGAKIKEMTSYVISLDD